MITAFMIWFIGWAIAVGYCVFCDVDDSCGTEEENRLWDEVLICLILFVMWPFLVGSQIYKLTNKKDE